MEQFSADVTEDADIMITSEEATLTLHTTLVLPLWATLRWCSWCGYLQERGVIVMDRTPSFRQVYKDGAFFWLDFLAINQHAAGGTHTCPLSATLLLRQCGGSHSHCDAYRSARVQ